jgi:single-stranded-DNA-specific exonuclease
MIWSKADLDPDEVREVARRYGLDLISASVLIRRNYTDNRSIRFILDSDPLRLHNPFLFRDMVKAVKRIRRAIAEQELIFIFGDRDVDGITSTVLLLEVLQRLGARVQWQIPVGEDDYGLTQEVVENLGRSGCRLLITVDCGISNQAETAQASGLGIDTIVVDHHNPPETLPEAVAIIDPKCRGSTYPFRDLAGCGVVAKLALALAFSETSMFNKPEWFLHIQPANETYMLEAVKLVNLAAVERVTDSLPVAAGRFETTRVYAALAGRKVFVYNREVHQKILQELGAGELELQDLQDEVAAVFPDFAGKSLLRIRELAKEGRFNGDGEMDVLLDLYTAVVWHKLDLLPFLESVLDLAALGTIADLMPLVNENKIIVKRGLAVMNQLKRPGLRELLIRQNLHGRRLTAKDISWHVAPVLNSAGRMGEPEKAAALFLPSTPERLELAIDAILELNRRRKSLGDKIWGSCFPQARSSLERTEGKFVFVSAEDIPRGITGILAARLVSFYKVPALVVSVGQEKAVGSLRSPYPADGFLDLFSEFFQNYGGHDRAAGFNLSAQMLGRFEERFFQVVRTYTPPDREEAKILIDAEVPPQYLNPELIRIVEVFEPYGEGCPPLVFLTRGVRIERLDIVGRKELAHVKMLLGVERYKWPAVYWNAAEKAGRDFNLNDTVDIVFRLNRNYYLNTETLQLTILDLKK